MLLQGKCKNRMESLPDVTSTGNVVVSAVLV